LAAVALAELEMALLTELLVATQFFLVSQALAVAAAVATHLLVHLVVLAVAVVEVAHLELALRDREIAVEVGQVQTTAQVAVVLVVLEI
jgi:hypothetical protein